MKKYITYLTLITAAFLATSCGDWLDVMQDDNIPEEVMFSSYDGYRNATNGIYQSMTDDGLFGKELSYGFASALSQYLRNASASNTLRYSYTEKYEYNTSEVLAFTEGIWQKGYKVIADCNNLIQHVEKADPYMFPEKFEYQVIAGEAYGVRAFMHFELLRMFGPVPAVGMAQKAIPYVDKYPSLFNERKTMREVMDRILADLEHAFDLMKDFEYPNGVVSSKFSAARFQIQTYASDLFMNGRGCRMNTMMVKSLMARVHAYMGDLETANLHASEVWQAAAVDKTYLKYTTWPTSATAVQPRKMLDELIFGVYNLNLAEKYEPQVKRTNYTYYQLKNIDYMYNNYRSDATDVRYTKLLEAYAPTGTGDNKYWYSLRFCYRSDYPGITHQTENCIIPLFRMSELRYIMAEYLARNGDIPGAVTILNELRTQRKCTRKILATVTLDQFMEELLYDMWKEFMPEGGHLFYQYKRLNATTIPTGETYIAMTPEKYVVPIPDSEERF